jgi:hypothetical protein
MSPPVKAELAGSITTLKDRLQTFYRHRDNTCEQDKRAVSGTMCANPPTTPRKSEGVCLRDEEAL